MLSVIIDYNSGNLHSVAKSLERVSKDFRNEKLSISSNPNIVSIADRIIFPGVGAFPDCKRALVEKKGLVEIMQEKVLLRKTPFLGICVGHQMLATKSLEFEQDTEGFDWINGTVRKINASSKNLKIPHMGWNSIKKDINEHPLLKNINNGDHFYFTHSYTMELKEKTCRLAHTFYGSTLTAAIVKENIAGTQFHPEKSQLAGLKFLLNFIKWRP